MLVLKGKWRCSIFFRIGSYETPSNSSWFSLRKVANVGQTGRKISDREFWTIHTVLTASSQSALDTAIAAHATGMRQNNVDLTFYKDDGSETAHKIVNSTTSNGITFRGISYPGYFPGQWGAHSEYVYLRYVVTQHEAEVFDVENNIVFYDHWFESNVGGSDYIVVGAFTGLPQTQFTMQQVPCWAVQQGVAIGMFSHPIPSGPLINLPVKPRESRIRRRSPQTFGRVQNWGYPTTWRYVYESPIPVTATPQENF